MRFREAKGVMLRAVLASFAFVASFSVAGSHEEIVPGVQTTVFHETFSGCTVGTDINGYNGWAGSATNLDPDFSVCDSSRYEGLPPPKYLTVSSSSVSLSSKYAYAYHDFTVNGGYTVKVKFTPTCNPSPSAFWSLLEVPGIGKVGYSNGGFWLDWTNGTSVVQDQTTPGVILDCGAIDLLIPPSYVNTIEISQSSLGASTWTFKVWNQTGTFFGPFNLNAATTNSASQVYLGWHTSPGDRGAVTYTEVLVTEP